MKSKLRWLLLLPLFALFAWAYQAASWRPKLIGVQPVRPIPKSALAPDTFFGPQILLSPDGQKLVSVADLMSQTWVTMSATGTRTKLWQQPDISLGRRESPLAFAPDSRALAVAVLQGAQERPYSAIVLLDAATGKRHGPQMLPYHYVRNLQSAAFLSNRELVISTTRGATVIDTQTGKAIRQWMFKLPALRTTRLPLPPQSHVSADGTTVLALANGPAETVVSLYDTKTGRQRGLWTYKDVERNPRLSPDGKLWAFFPEGARGLLIVHDARTGVEMWNKFQGYFWAWSADSQRIISLLNPSVAQSDARTGHDLGEVPGPYGAEALALGPNGDTFYTLDNQGKIWRWRLR